MATKFKVWVDDLDNSNVLSYENFANDPQRESGFSAGQAASSSRVNTALRQSSLVVAALMDICAPDSGLDVRSSMNDVKNALSQYFGRAVKNVIYDDDSNKLLVHYQNGGQATIDMKSTAVTSIDNIEALNALCQVYPRLMGVRFTNDVILDTDNGDTTIVKWSSGILITTDANTSMLIVTGTTNAGGDDNACLYVAVRYSAAWLSCRKLSIVAGLVGGVYGAVSADCHVWFSRNNEERARAYTSRFTYNPYTDVLKVGSITGKATTAGRADSAASADVATSVLWSLLTSGIYYVPLCSSLDAGTMRTGIGVHANLTYDIVTRSIAANISGNAVSASFATVADSVSKNTTSVNDDLPVLLDGSSSLSLGAEVRISPNLKYNPSSKKLSGYKSSGAMTEPYNGGNDWSTLTFWTSDGGGTALTEGQTYVLMVPCNNFEGGLQTESEEVYRQMIICFHAGLDRRVLHDEYFYYARQLRRIRVERIDTQYLKCTISDMLSSGDDIWEDQSNPPTAKYKRLFGNIDVNF